MELPCKFKASDDVQITCSKDCQNIFRIFDSVDDCNNFTKNEICYLSSGASNKIYPNPPDVYEHTNYSGSTHILGIYASSWTTKIPTEHLDRCVVMAGLHWFEVISLLLKNLCN